MMRPRFHLPGVASLAVSIAMLGSMSHLALAAKPQQKGVPAVPVATAPTDASTDLPEATPVAARMPQVPVGVVPSAVVANPPASIAEELLNPIALTMHPGVVEITTIAVTHLNRIVTPFSNPVLHTTSTSVKWETKGSVVYVATATKGTSSIYITEGQNEAVALSLTLVAREIPPREITLKLPDDVLIPPSHGTAVRDGTGKVNGSPASDGSANESMPYVADIRRNIHAIGLGKVPDGYAMRRLNGHDQLPYCGLPPGLVTDWSKAQLMDGATTEIVVGVLKSNLHVAIEPQEVWCGTDDVMAVAFWPRNYLEPGSETEVIILRHRPVPHVSGTERPSLVRN